MSNRELTHELRLALERLDNLEKRFLNFEHRTLPVLNWGTFVPGKKCVECGIETISKRDEKEWCTTCGYKNWTE